MPCTNDESAAVPPGVRERRPIIVSVQVNAPPPRPSRIAQSHGAWAGQSIRPSQPPTVTAEKAQGSQARSPTLRIRNRQRERQRNADRAEQAEHGSGVRESLSPASTRIAGNQPNCAYAWADWTPNSSAIAHASRDWRQLAQLVVRVGEGIDVHRLRAGRGATAGGPPGPERPRRRCPSASRRAPTSSGTVDERGDRPAAHQRSAVRGTDAGDVIGEVPLGQRRKQDVADRAPGQRDDRRTAGTARGSRRVTEPTTPVTASPSTRTVVTCRPELRDHAVRGDAGSGEAQHRQRRQQSGGGDRHAEVAAQRIEHDADAADGRSQVDGEQDDRDADQPASGASWRRHRTILRAAVRG